MTILLRIYLVLIVLAHSVGMVQLVLHHDQMLAKYRDSATR